MTEVKLTDNYMYKNNLKIMNLKGSRDRPLPQKARKQGGNHALASII